MSYIAIAVYVYLCSIVLFGLMTTSLNKYYYYLSITVKHKNKISASALASSQLRHYGLSLGIDVKSLGSLGVKLFAFASV